MSLPSLSIKRPVFAWMLTLGIMLLGYVSLRELGVGLYPDIDFPVVSVSVNYPGSSPELIETDITETLEGALSGVQGVEGIYSESRFGSARVSLEFNLSKNIDVAVQEVNTAVQGALQRLPKDAETPVVSKSNPDDSPILWLALRADIPLRDLMFYAQTTLRDRLSTVEGVADVNLAGFVDPAVRVWLDVDKLREFELTHSDIVNSIRTEHLEVPAGRITNPKDEVNVRFLGEAPTLEDLSNLPVVKRGGQPLYRRIVLNQLGKVEKGLAEIRRYSRADGQTAIGLGIRKQRGSNAVAVADAVKKRISSMELPKGYFLTVNFDSTREIKKSIHELTFTLILSSVLTAVVCWFFLGSLASTFNIALAIPVSLFGTFIVFKMLGYTLNSFTMLGLILSIGIIVDDAIVVLENIFRVRKLEPDPLVAAQRGAEEVQLAAIATSLSLIAVFVPIIFVEGIIGRYFAQFAVVMSIAVAWSTFEALTFTPMRMAKFKAPKKNLKFLENFDQWIDRVSQRYMSWVEKIMNSRYQGRWIYPATIILFAGSLVLLKFLPKELAPKEDTGALFVRAELPLGTSLNETTRRMSELEAMIKSYPEVQRTYSTVGGFGGGGGAVNMANIFVTLKELGERKTSQDALSETFRNDIKTKMGKDMRVILQGRGGISLGGNNRGFDMDFKLKGSNWQDLVNGSKLLEKELKELPEFQDVNSSYKDGSPEFAIVPERLKALQSWVSVTDIGQTLSFLYNGITAAKFNDDGRRVDILVQADPATLPRKAEDFKKISVRNSRSELIPMSELVTFRDQTAPVSITRENRERSISVSANLPLGKFLEKSLARAKEIAGKVLPASVRLDESGTAADVKKSSASLGYAFLFGIVAAFMVLASQFNSLLQPAIILLSIPFGLTGAFLALLLAGSTLNIYSMIGLILLMGIVMKNGILLVEFSNLEMRSGKNKKDAVLAACRTRLRPIMMTALTTAASAVLPAFKIGISAESSSSMAMAILGGLMFSTLITLFLVPMAYFHFVKKAPAH